MVAFPGTVASSTQLQNHDGILVVVAKLELSQKSYQSLPRPLQIMMAYLY